MRTRNKTLNYLIPLLIILLTVLLIILNGVRDAKEINIIIRDNVIKKVVVFGLIGFITRMIIETILLFVWANYIKRIKAQFFSLFSANSLTYVPILINNFLFLFIPAKYGDIFSIEYLIKNNSNELPPFVVFTSKILTVFLVAEIILKGYVIKKYIKIPLTRGIIIVIVYFSILYYVPFAVLNYFHD